MIGSNLNIIFIGTQPLIQTSIKSINKKISNKLNQNVKINTQEINFILKILFFFVFLLQFLLFFNSKKEKISTKIPSVFKWKKIDKVQIKRCICMKEFS